MKLELFGKAMMFVYYKLPFLIEETDGYIEKYALCSSNINYLKLLNAETYAERVIDCMESKKKMLVMFDAIEDAFSKCSDYCQKVLRLRYLQVRSPAEMKKELGVCERTVFRHINSAVLQFSKSLKALGYSSREFLEGFKDEVWLKNILYRVYISQRKQRKKCEAISAA